ncbi:MULTISPECIES: indolepyruvate ferredoxin oxidoreductase family protein [unclassified Undibacterium]|uniref:indolepyruvate ferredoxin oxidoreductase family protein n=1 Tax=unclassified Undibacterium TaxID=2630295 RepID=UPI002AC89D56|nr:MULTISPECIES: indolepyruvate ferredoxin oxidoreductase family protein [unclassified Undibacterium]MEB0141061.1 indolepyruvate ferredoxin oxidoreductase family protein [Undibacterium sp. CCC2.1]MEB0174061.1 indolepyruvate ferredoxin oxidoreductase family protein [Undibacterium sp. CCC1.1]MEB0178021.1 indolepyruvate ferredoxin oxidoreductase family protein [Undibacterium sp. CCC3.4]MEB0217232.1 indolepyruvate ferredoxin oxidoreductase family protein [Undibacterium sp. 5I2]WPX45022.1 indolepyr
MNAPLKFGSQELIDTSITLDDKFTLERGRAFMTGTQALIRLMMLQQQADQQAGLNTAGYISGYRGSPLGNVDLTAAKAKKHLARHHVKFHPGVNEDLAATSVWGTQQVNMFPGAKYDGVFAMWYGKGPGVDRCGDVFKHANLAGTSPHGGVLVVAGDDHAAKSSTAAHQSEHILKACGIPVLYPSTVQEYLDYGLHGIALSRYTGLWVSMKCVTDIVESGAVVEIDPDRVKPIIPSDFVLPADGVNIRTPDPVLAQETRMNNYKWYAALAYVRANKLNQIIWDSPVAKIGIITAGKSYLDTRQALADLGIDEQVARDIGIRLYKIGMTWPLESEGVREFATGLEEILVVEEKRQILEYALKEELYNWEDKVRPRVVGKFDDSGEWSNLHGSGHGEWLLPATYELSPAQIARAIASRISRYFAGHPVAQLVQQRVAYLEAKENMLVGVGKPDPNKDRVPHFCSGCPHNTSTKVPAGSRALAGIGCHYMVTWMDRETSTFTHMGAEGVTWVGQAPFTDEKHVFCNLGDGTYYHSGLLAIRAAVSGEVNITYKILFNDAVAMTGGQEFDGPLDPGIISRQIAAEGVGPIIVVTDEPEKYPSDYPWAPGVTVRHRRDLDAVQRELRAAVGVSAMIYDQTCASEKRRRRKKIDKNGQPGFPDPAKRAVINEAVCEGCGDCSVQSNCLSVEPLETELGRKRQINQSSCNKDFSCVNGFCPSFVTVEGGKLKKPAKTKIAPGHALDVDSLPYPSLPSTATPFGVLVTGVGGTGVVTIGQIMAMAAHLQGKACSVLDMTGLAQKGGAVMSHVRLADRADDIQSTRVGTGMADLVIGCDLIVTAGKDALSRMGEGRTHAAINANGTPTATFIKNPDWQFPGQDAADDIRKACGNDRVDMIDAAAIATALMGDNIATNMFLLGYAWQKGWVPLQHSALMRAIELNGVAIDFNKQAFNWGRLAAHDLLAVTRLAAPAQVIEIKRSPGVDELIATRTAFLSDYQDAAYAAQYSAFVAQVRAAESRLVDGKPLRLTEAVAKYLFKLMAYKDEYEVARLYTDGKFEKKIAALFEGDYAIHYHLAPPLFAKRDADGHLIKQQFGPWMKKAFGVLAGLKSLRGGPFDVFGYTEERRMERALPLGYRADIVALLPLLTTENLAKAVALASIPEDIRGYGHVKERHLAAAKLKQAGLLAEFHQKSD